MAGAQGDETLSPTPDTKRTFSALDFLGLWAGLVVNVPSFYLATSLVSLGLSPAQSLAAILAADLLLLPVLALSGLPGHRLGLPFPPLLFPAFGRRGGSAAALLRAAVAVGWSAVESWIVARAAVLLLLPSHLRSMPKLPLLGASVAELAAFSAAVAAQLAVVLHGMAAVRVLGKYSSPLLAALTIWLFCWAYTKAGGFGPMMSGPSRPGPARFWPVFFAAVTASLSSWATLAVNISDFARFSRSEMGFVLGQVGLPVFMGLFGFAGMAIASATEVIFGRVIANPVDLLAEMAMPVWLNVVAFIGIALAAITTNIPANFVAPANVLVAVSPSMFTFARGAAVAALASVLFQPWRLMGSSESYVYTWLIGYSTVLGPISGIFLADYYIVRRGVVDVHGLFLTSPRGPYDYMGGFNIPAFVALGLSMGPMVPGFLQKLGVTQATSATFAAIYDNAWFFGFFSAGIIYWTLCHCRRGGKESDDDDDGSISEPLRPESA